LTRISADTHAFGGILPPQRDQEKKTAGAFSLTPKKAAQRL